MMAPMIIAVVGGENCTPDAEASAEAVGRELARRGCVLICGGRGGVMAAACRGARSQGGHTIGVFPGPDRAEANPWVQFPVVTGMGEARNAVIVRSADALIAVGGAYGTLSEIAFALKLGRPVRSAWAPGRSRSAGPKTRRSSAKRTRPRRSRQP